MTRLRAPHIDDSFGVSALPNARHGEAEQTSGSTARIVAVLTRNLHFGASSYFYLSQ